MFHLLSAVILCWSMFLVVNSLIISLERGGSQNERQGVSSGKLFLLLIFATSIKYGRRWFMPRDITFTSMCVCPLAIVTSSQRICYWMRIRTLRWQILAWPLSKLGNDSWKQVVGTCEMSNTPTLLLT